MAVGLALADRMQGRHRVSLFFGEGAVAEGEFHESANLAALWQLPVLFCCENNLCWRTALARSESDTSMALKAAAYEMPAGEWTAWMSGRCRGERSRRRCRTRRHGTALLELMTYRFRAHSMYDPERYRRCRGDRVAPA